MDDIKREELEKACKKEKDHKVRTRMVAVRMVLVLDTSDTAPSWRAAEGFKSPWISLDNAAFSGSARMMPPGSRARSQDRNVSPIFRLGCPH